MKCESCQATVAIVFNPSLSKSATNRLIGWYKTLLADAHHVSCPFRRVAQQYLKSNDDQDNYNADKSSDPTKPASTEARYAVSSSFVALASVLPRTEVELLERIRPSHQIRTLAMQLVSFVESDQLVPYQNIPAHIASKLSPLVLSQIMRRLFPTQEQQQQGSNGDADKERKSLESALLLVLFGWRVMKEDKDEQDDSEPSAASERQITPAAGPAPGQSLSPPLLYCPLCLATLSVPTSNCSLGVALPDGDTRITDADISSPPATKRSRKETCVGPWNAHRYYCPYVCGFPQTAELTATTTTTTTRTTSSPTTTTSNKPVWEDLLEKLICDDDTDSRISNTGTPETFDMGADGGDNVSLQQERKPSKWMLVRKMLSQGLAAAKT